MARKSLYRKTIEKVAVPWALSHGFSRASAHVFVRPSATAHVLEVVELQKSIKHPYRTFTVNLGLFHSGTPIGQLPPGDDLIPAHCQRRIRIGHVMSKSYWRRGLLWLRFGSGWLWYQFFPGDFWWSYRDTEESVTDVMSHSLTQVENQGFRWLHESAAGGWQEPADPSRREH